MLFLGGQCARADESIISAIYYFDWTFEDWPHSVGLGRLIGLGLMT